MNVPLQLKQITQHTTQVAFSTSFLLGGCVAAGREEETLETVDVDAGDDAIIESVRYNRAEQASHAYHSPDAPVVMPLGLEDAPTSMPPTASLNPPREPKEKRIKQAQSRARTGGEAEEEGVVVYSYELTTAARAKADGQALEAKAAKTAKAEPSDDPEREERPAAKKKSEKPRRDPVGESFLHTYGGTDSYQTRSSGTRY